MFMLVFAVGFLVFFWGIIEFLFAQNGIGIGGKSSDDALREGKQHMLWGVVGMFIIFAAYSLVALVIQIVGGSIVECAPSGYNSLELRPDGLPN